MALSQRGWLKFKIQISTYTYTQKYSKLRCLLGVKGLLICFYLDWFGSKSWLLTCSNDITLSLPSYTGYDLKTELNLCNGYLSLLYFWLVSFGVPISWGLLNSINTFCLGRCPWCPSLSPVDQKYQFWYGSDLQMSWPDFGFLGVPGPCCVL